MRRLSPEATEAFLALLADPPEPNAALKRAWGEYRAAVAGGDIELTPSCGNVFADLGLPDAEELLREAEAAIAEGAVTTAEWRERLRRKRE